MPHGWGRVPFTYADRLPWMSLPFPVEEYEGRLQRLRSLMAWDGWDCAVVVGNQVDRANIRYLFGTACWEDVWRVTAAGVERLSGYPIRWW